MDVRYYGLLARDVRDLMESTAPRPPDRPGRRRGHRLSPARRWAAALLRRAADAVAPAPAGACSGR